MKKQKKQNPPRRLEKMPNPGTPEALKMGCECPVMDNNYGRGSGYKNADGTPAFYFSEGCPVHSCGR